ncbi:hypothetical protein JEQ12_019167 [Ovis aries]|uniref:Uncharacterized protein n=1 Tax=Ovis aries TaxID=9940 RepID=A0A836CZ13_SHEEP|nr:hypothetical protein JEQ12_019167 [Ovis aries]
MESRGTGSCTVASRKAKLRPSEPQAQRPSFPGQCSGTPQEEEASLPEAYASDWLLTQHLHQPRTLPILHPYPQPPALEIPLELPGAAKRGWAARGARGSGGAGAATLYTIDIIGLTIGSTLSQRLLCHQRLQSSQSSSTDSLICASEVTLRENHYSRENQQIPELLTFWDICHHTLPPLLPRVLPGLLEPSPGSVFLEDLLEPSLRHILPRTLDPSCSPISFLDFETSYPDLLLCVLPRPLGNLPAPVSCPDLLDMQAFTEP